MTESVEQSLAAAFKKVGPSYKVIAAYLYGSQVRGQVHAGSDIDVAVLQADDGKGATLKLLKLGQRLEAVAGLKNIDVRLLNAAPLAARGRILTEGRLLYSADESTRVDFEVKTRSLYFDFLPHLNFLQKAFIEHAAREGL